MKSVLVIRLSSLGDVVLTGAVYRNLRSAWPRARIVVLTKPAYAPFVARHPCVDEVIPFRGLWRTLRELRARRFTHLLDLHANLRSLLLSAFSGAGRRSRYRKDALARRLFVWTRRSSPRLERHVLDRYLEALAEWDVPIPHRTPELAEWRGSSAPPPAFRRIAVLQTAFLGDAVLTRPLLEGIREAFPSARIAVMCRPETAEVFGPLADETIPIAKGGGLFSIGSAAKRLAGADLALIPHRSLRSALIARIAGIPRRVGFTNSSGRWLMTDLVPFSWLLHDAERNLSLLSPFTTPRTPAARVPRRTGAERIRGLARPLIGMHPGSIWATKRWLPERFAELARRLIRTTGGTVALIGGPGDRKLAAGIAASSGALNWAGRTELAELLAVMPEFDLFITNDSGPMHVATGCGVATLAFFGPTTKELGFFPYGKGHRVLEAELACRPCGLHGARVCPEGHFLCMRLITVEQAHDAAVGLLAGKTPAERIEAR